MHLHRGGDGALDLQDLLVALDVSLVDDRPNEVQGGPVGHIGGSEPEQIGQLHGVLCAVGRQVPDLPPRAHGPAHHRCQCFPRPHVRDPDPLRPIGDGGQVPHPDDVVDGELVAEDGRPALIEIHDGGQLRLIESEVVEEAAVLTKGIGVVGVVHRAFGVAEEEQHSAVESRPQSLPAPVVDMCREHLRPPIARRRGRRSASAAFGCRHRART